ncbi:MAG: hypothetical protein Q9N68_10250 [Gammaproteobacteria bacterium]|nr:hypothetical protein [Gammaproteobacteria bacterium]
MSTMVVELYEALTKAGVDEELAKQAAKAVLDTEILATKKDLAEMKTEIIMWNTGTLLAATGLFALIVKLIG